MTNITKAAQDDQALAALDRLVETHSRNYHPFANPLASDAQAALRHLRAALQDKAAEVQGYEPAGFLLHWPEPGGGRDILWSKDGAAGHAIGCPVTEVFKATDLASHPAPVVPDGFALVPVEANDEILRPFRYCPDDQLFLAWRASIRIAASQQKGGQ